MNTPKHQALEQFTKDKNHYSKNEPQVLDKFLFYAQSCKDPLNIYKYMDEKSICTYLSSYWAHKAEYFADQGDYRNSFQCLKQAKSRSGIIDQERQILELSSEKTCDPADKMQAIRRRMIEEMKRFPIKGKRTIDQFSLLSNNCEGILGDEQAKNRKLLQFYETKYIALRREKEKKQFMKLQNRPVSWLFEAEVANQENLRLLEEKVLHSNSHKFIRDGNNTCMSLKTPLKHKDPMRLTKTMDSVEMLKKKKSTLQKLTGRNQPGKSQYQSQAEDSNSLNVQSHQVKFNTVPVGRSLSDLKRRVTFSIDTAMLKLQKIRKNQDEEEKQSVIGHQGNSQKTDKSVNQKSGRDKGWSESSEEEN